MKRMAKSLLDVSALGFVGILIAVLSSSVPIAANPNPAVASCSPGFPVCAFDPQCSGRCRAWECYTIPCDMDPVNLDWCYVCERENVEIE